MNVTKHNGFTLIEVVVALAILASTLYGGFFLLNQTTTNSYYLRDTVLANWVASNAHAITVLDRVAVNEQDAQINEQTVMYGEEFLVTYNYEQSLSSNDQGNPSPDAESTSSEAGQVERQKITISVAKRSEPNTVLENIVVFR